MTRPHVLAGLLAAIALLPSCRNVTAQGSDAGESHSPIIMLGIDGATRTIMDPLMAQGRLPHLKALADRGVYSALGTREPTISPIIWTSIATGKVEGKHGVDGFTAPIPDTEKLVRLKVPEARSELRLSVTAMAHAPLRSQRFALFVAGRDRAAMELLTEPRTKEMTVKLDAPVSEIALRFESSATREPRSPFYVLAYARIEVSSDGGKARALTPADQIGGVYDQPVDVRGESYLELGGPHEIATMSSNMRRVKAIWNILSERRQRVMVAGYWVTWPAEAVNGVMISSYTSARYGRSKKGSFLRDFPHQTHPESLATELQPVLDEAIALGRQRAEQAAARFGVKLRPIPAGDLKPIQRFVTTMAQAVPPKPSAEDPAEQLVWIASSDTFYALAAAKLWPKERPDLTIVYTGEVDVTSHDWWSFEKDLSQGVIAQAYERADQALGRILDALGPEAEAADVLVCSDHGFAFDKRGVFEHQFTHPPGILIAAGPDIVPGSKPVDPTVLDIAPTLLAMARLPVARDMDGRVLAEILAAPAPEPIATYETGPPPGPAKPIVSPIDEKVKDQLRALGYIQ